MRRILLLFVMVALFAAGAQAQINGVTLSLSLGQSEFLPDEDLYVTVKVVNRSGQTLSLKDIPQWLTFSVFSDSGVPVSKTGDVALPDDAVLKSAQTGIYRFNLTPGFDFHAIGHYRVTAQMRVPQWDQETRTAPVFFSVIKGIPVELQDMHFGVPLPQGVTNRAPEMRQYVLEKGPYKQTPMLYFRLMNDDGTRTIKCYALGRIVMSAKPEAQIDAECNLHILSQYYAQSFFYYVINPEGQVLKRQAHDISQSRPTLKADSEGRIFVSGGIRHFSSDDLPATTTTHINTADEVKSKK